MTTQPFFEWAVVSVFLSMATARGTVLHVKATGNDSLSGTSWVAAKRSVTNALAGAAAGDEIWVAEGKYFEAVVMKADVALFGGFCRPAAASTAWRFTRNKDRAIRLKLESY